MSCFKSIKGRLSYHLCVECFSQLSFDSEMYTKSATDIFHSSAFGFGQMGKCSFSHSLNGHIVQKLILSAKYFDTRKKMPYKRSDFQSKVQHSASVFGRRPHIFFTLLPSGSAECENAALVIHWMACTLCKNWAFQQNLLSPAKKNKKIAFKRSDLQSKITTNTTSS